MNGDPALLGVTQEFTKEHLATMVSFGYHLGDKGTHTSRTIMLSEFSQLLNLAGPDAALKDYRSMIVEDNCLGKATKATRRLTFQRLSELYALDSGVPLFRLLRRFWQGDERGRPLLALLMSLARDPLLRLTAPPIIRMQRGQELGRQSLTDALNRGTGSRFNEAVLDKIVRNTASSWTQSMHLTGRSRKTRCAVSATPSVLAFALLLGYGMGMRGSHLFESLWTKVLDSSVDELIYLAMDAKRLGFLDLKVAGGVVEVSPVRLLNQEERRMLHGKD